MTSVSRNYLIVSLILVLLLVNTVMSNLSTQCSSKQIISPGISTLSANQVTVSSDQLLWNGVQSEPITFQFQIQNFFSLDTVYSIFLSTDQEIQITHTYDTSGVDANNIVEYQDYLGSTFRYQFWFRNKQYFTFQITPQINGAIIINYQVFFANALQLDGTCVNKCSQQHFEIKLSNLQQPIPTALCYDDYYLPIKPCNPSDVIDQSSKMTVSGGFGSQIQDLGNNFYRPIFDSQNKLYFAINFGSNLLDDNQIYAVQILANQSITYQNAISTIFNPQATQSFQLYFHSRQNSTYKFKSNFYLFFRGNDILAAYPLLVNPKGISNVIVKIFFTKFSIYGIPSCRTTCLNQNNLTKSLFLKELTSPVIYCDQQNPFPLDLKYQCYGYVSRKYNLLHFTALNPFEQLDYQYGYDIFLWKSRPDTPLRLNINFQYADTTNSVYQIKIVIFGPGRVTLYYTTSQIKPNILLENFETYDTLQRNQAYITTKALSSNIPIKIAFLSDVVEYQTIYIWLYTAPVVDNTLTCSSTCQTQISFIPAQFSALTSHKTYCGNYLLDPQFCVYSVPNCDPSYCQYISSFQQFQCQACIGQLTVNQDKKSCYYNCSDFHCLSCSADTQGIIKCTSCLDYYGLNLSTQKCIPCPGGVNCINCAQKQWSITKGKITTNYNEFVCTKCANGSLPRQSNKAPYYTCR